jgi:hypothetical protein
MNVQPYEASATILLCNQFWAIRFSLVAGLKGASKT